jgi:hypothetical protein
MISLSAPATDGIDKDSVIRLNFFPLPSSLYLCPLPFAL